MSERGYPSPIHDESGKIKDVTVAQEMARAEEGARNKARQEKRRLFGLLGPSKGTLKKEGAKAAEPIEEGYREAKEAKDAIFAKLKQVGEKKGFVVFQTEYANPPNKGISYSVIVETKMQKGAISPYPILQVAVEADPPSPMEIIINVGAYPDPKKGTYIKMNDPVAAMNQAARIVENSREYNNFA